MATFFSGSFSGPDNEIFDQDRPAGLHGWDRRKGRKKKGETFYQTRNCNRFYDTLYREGHTLNLNFILIVGRRWLGDLDMRTDNY